MRNLLTMSVLVAAATSCLTPNADAQITDKQKAVVAFELYMERLTSSDLAKETGMESPTGSLPIETNDKLQVDEIRRVYGAMSAPADIASLQAATSGQQVENAPFEFFVRMQYKSAKAAETAFADMAAEGRPETIGGVDYIRPPADSEGTPQNMLAHLSAPDTFEIGTDTYILNADRKVFSDHLMAAWPKMPKAAIRIGVDLDGVRHLIDEGLQMAEAQGGIPAPAQPAVALLNDMSVMRIGLDFSGDNLLWLTATGRDSDATTRINGVLGGFTAMGKGMGQQFLPMAPPKAQGPAKVILDALGTTVEGDDVNITIPRPEGLEAAVGELFGQMMMAGMGPGGMDAGGPGDFGADPLGEPSGLDAMPAGDPFGEPAPAGAPGADPFGF